MTAASNDADAAALGEPVPAPDPVSSRRSRRGLVRALVVVGVLAALVVGDWFWRNVEMSHLLADVRASEVPMEGFNARASSASKTLDQKGNATTDDDRAEFRKTVNDAADFNGASLIAATGALEDEWFAPWHVAQRRARDRYLDHARVWTTALHEYGAEPEHWGDSHAEISGTFQYAERTMRAALGPVPLFGNAQKVDDIFAH
ncbi:hypothetical protein Cch01nite_07590 [Cellulomonas chitinilytica]|uniref:Uncharacterized protein n=1 Tax=Cellulomonas chitinilytica TaxID=398759 RepID=A0A919NZS5_9CELL|nr:hypothetical protein [Cellulomonas chitinilytica]GIG20035.1 hypothetical protein Cch01nite_07590 [Cellulomonas chitinilytica]